MFCVDSTANGGSHCQRVIDVDIISIAYIINCFISQKKKYTKLVMDSGKYFARSEKHDLIKTFKEDRDSKKVKEATSSTNFSKHVFEESFYSLTCRNILLNYLKNLKSKMI